VAREFLPGGARRSHGFEFCQLGGCGLVAIHTCRALQEIDDWVEGTV